MEWCFFWREAKNNFQHPPEIGLYPYVSSHPGYHQSRGSAVAGPLRLHVSYPLEFLSSPSSPAVRLKEVQPSKDGWFSWVVLGDRSIDPWNLKRMKKQKGDRDRDRGTEKALLNCKLSQPWLEKACLLLRSLIQGPIEVACRNHWVPMVVVQRGPSQSRIRPWANAEWKSGPGCLCAPQANRCFWPLGDDRVVALWALYGAVGAVWRCGHTGFAREVSI